MRFICSLASPRRRVIAPMADGLELASFFVQLVTAGAAAYIAILGLKASAKPKVAIQTTAATGLPRIASGQEDEILFAVRNVGYWYARRAATDLRLYFNVDLAVELLSARYGPELELETSDVKLGKGPSRYVLVTGIYATYGDPPENVLIRVRAPNAPGTYSGWVHAFSAEGDCGRHPFQFVVFELPEAASG